MLIQAVLFLVGITALYYGAEWLVQGAARLARAAGITPLVVGLTVVAFGTSAPELVVSVVASLRGQGDIALGNVVGSNIMNLALIVGVAAVICPLAVQMTLILREAPIMVAASVLVPLLMLDGSLSRLDGGALVVLLVAYLVFVVRASRRETSEVQSEFEHFEDSENRGPSPASSTWRNVGLVALGTTVLVGGAQFLVGSAVFFARAIGISELVVGLTVVAIGTSLPELATSVVAAMRGEPDIALGNAVGSNIFNLLSILGFAALAAPLAASTELLVFEIPVMVGISILFPVLAYARRRLGRWEGALLLACYVGFTVVLLVRSA